MKVVDVAALRVNSGAIAPLRRLLIGIAAAVISGVTLVSPILLPQGATSIASANADPCPAVQVVFA
ncbi:MAG TPA: hypothetical protein VN888_16285, partial [Mycobacterium sp.]|nr:hypothetical protein [Mycobacterium sp.]